MNIDWYAAKKLADEMLEILDPVCQRIEIGGSVRRQKALVKDIEIVAISAHGGLLNARLDKLVSDGVIEKAQYGLSGTRWGEKYRGFVYGETRFEVFQAVPDTWGYIHWLRTGPGDAGHYVMSRMYGTPYQCVEGWVTYAGRRISVPEELDFFRLFGMAWVTPAQRTLERYEKWLPPVEFWQTPEDLVFVDAADAQLPLIGD